MRTEGTNVSQTDLLHSVLEHSENLSDGANENDSFHSLTPF